jgi:hypothetical protein
VKVGVREKIDRYAGNGVEEIPKNAERNYYVIITTLYTDQLPLAKVYNYLTLLRRNSRLSNSPVKYLTMRNISCITLGLLASTIAVDGDTFYWAIL